MTRRHAEHFFSRPFHSPVSEPHSAHMWTCLWRAMAGFAANNAGLPITWGASGTVKRVSNRACDWDVHIDVRRPNVVVSRRQG